MCIIFYQKIFTSSLSVIPSYFLMIGILMLLVFLSQLHQCSYLGYCFAVYHVGPNGWTKLSGDDVGELHYKYYPVVPTPVEHEMADAPAAWKTLYNCHSKIFLQLEIHSYLVCWILQWLFYQLETVSPFQFQTRFEELFFPMFEWNMGLVFFWQWRCSGQV